VRRQHGGWRRTPAWFRLTANVTETQTLPAFDLERLFKLRLVVARTGEMDVARWWNTKGQLGRMGASVLRRGFPGRTTLLRLARCLRWPLSAVRRCSTRLSGMRDSVAAARGS
jgi:hypothetical protein